MILPDQPPTTGSSSSAPAPTNTRPQSSKSAPRLLAVIEVVLCSGFPTQLVLTVLLGTLGLAALDATGQLSLGYVVLLSLTDAALVLGLIFCFLWTHGEAPREVFLGARSLRQEFTLGIVLVPLLVIVAAAGLGTLRLLAPELSNVPENPFKALISSPASAALFAVVAIVAGGLREELQRAFILRRFEQHLGGGWLGLVVFSVAFGLGHQIQGWDAAFVTAALGAVWGAIYLLRRSALVPIVSHAGFNVAEILLAFAATGC